MSMPIRFSLSDFLGNKISLPTDDKAWELIKYGENAILLLGLYTDTYNLSFIKNKKVFFLKGPQIYKTISAPNTWEEISTEQILQYTNICETYFYTQNMKIDPKFWGPILGDIFSKQIKTQHSKNKCIFLPGNQTQLLHNELLTILKQMQFNVVDNINFPRNKFNFEDIKPLFDTNLPDIFLSINFRGFDKEGILFHLLNSLNIPVVIWLVDNPWNILTGYQFPWWKSAYIFVTDHSFIKQLKDNGAKNVYHLPLAYSPHMWLELTNNQNNEPPIFIGRASFPSHKKFFAACHIPDNLYKNASNILETNQSPDTAPNFHWWQKQTKTPFWPKQKIRIAGAGADKISQIRRGQWINEAYKQGFKIIGDKTWEQLIPNLIVEKPIDYYTKLPTYYSKSKAVLNVTSLLLPYSLNQRHFDVWAAGGFLFTDNTQGLSIFPRELTEPIIINEPKDIKSKLNYILKNQDIYNDLRKNWRKTISNEHSYINRLNSIFDIIHS